MAFKISLLSLLFLLQTYVQDKCNYILPADTALKFELEYNNLMRASNNISALAGVDILVLKDYYSMK